MIPESMEHPSFRALAESNEKMRIAPVSGSPNETSARGGLDSIVREFTYWRFFRKCYKHISADSRPDVVFVPYLDYCLYAIGLLGSPFVNCPWVGLAMRPSFHYQATGVVAPKPALASIKKRLFFRLLRNRNLPSSSIWIATRSSKTRSYSSQSLLNSVICQAGMMRRSTWASQWNGS